MAFYVFLLGVTLGVFVWLFQYDRISLLVDRITILNVYKFDFFYDFFINLNYDQVRPHLLGIAKKPVSAKAHQKAIEKYQKSAYLAWRWHYFVELFVLTEVIAMVLVIPALVYNASLGWLIVGYIFGIVVPTTARRLMSTSIGISLILVYRFISEKAYTSYGIKTIAAEIAEAEKQAITPTIPDKKLPTSLKDLPNWRRFKIFWWSLDAVICLVATVGLSSSANSNILPWYQDAYNPFTFALLLQLLFFIPGYIIFQLYARSFLQKPKIYRKLQKILAKYLGLGTG